jgi:hypothetical protein
MLLNAAHPAKALYARLLKAEGDRLRLAVKVFEVRTPNEIEGAVAEAASWRADGLLVATIAGLLQPHRARIAEASLRRQPGTSSRQDFCLVTGQTPSTTSVPQQRSWTRS